MDTQALQLDAPQAAQTERARSKKMLALISGAAVLVILAALGVYYVAFRSLPTTVSWAPSVAAIAPGGDLTVSGRVTPAESGRQVSFERAPNAQSPWQPMPQAATTDSRGRFTMTYMPQFTGSIVMRVVVDPSGRYLAVTGLSQSVRLLTLSSITLKGGGVIPTRTPLNFTVAVDPPSAGRSVVIEQSSDKVRWVPVGPAAQTTANGTAVVKVPGPAAGVWSYRATVAQDDKSAAAVSPLVGATVEDIKAAAATYLLITNEFNVANKAFNKVLTRASNLPGVPTNYRASARAYSSANTKAAAQLQAYGAWPQSVKPLIDQIFAQYVMTADSSHQMAADTSWEQWNREFAQIYTTSDKGSRISTLIRQALGLPQRAID